MNELIKKIELCQKMSELDALRMECVTTGKSDAETFQTIQKAFIKKKNQLNRIPLFERNW